MKHTKMIKKDKKTKQITKTRKNTKQQRSKIKTEKLKIY